MQTTLRFLKHFGKVLTSMTIFSMFYTEKKADAASLSNWHVKIQTHVTDRASCL